MIVLPQESRFLSGALGIGIGIPKLDVAKNHRDANYYGLLIVVLR